ncbi:MULTISPECIES: Txe/YoeB family addiction module toxin [Pseudomonas]|jgi:toxin YoeB|uniref:Txe/YoeB family addiction module toxin n=1 Tax=Pseudomonas TaxID=286 RepID=UPI000908CF2F|nr:MULTISPECIES: Txe/YoeB family addiction module toxin [Pseudomonas]MDT8907396.1 Txe/YoeB family addiction module toxin [Pseudomonas prosekii]NHN70078.1 Txe/YoeB family addiction module toxin [Pseudomonas fluorescens]SFW18715.1 toxin YoeB [Pseudomonas sp. NFACC09-4]SFX05352.1 toxin YoeB [Pseudomonas sp. NFACC36]SFX32538.1 toxin YoeB [Pseudomonas sp. NFACC47-1]
MSAKQKQKNKANARENVVIAFVPDGWEDYQYWDANDPTKHATVDELIEACLRDPFKGVGRPEPLKGDLTDYWSRRIDKEHRFVYAYENDTLTVISCRFHYTK